MSEDTLLHSIGDDGIAVVTLNRPQLHNAFDDELIARLTTLFHELGGRDDVRVVLLAANGKSFSAGADLNWMRRMADYNEEENYQDAMRLADMLRTLNELPKPTIALVQGAAFGGGVGLVACCDIVLAAPRATFSLSEVKLGIIPAVISPYVVSAIGPRMARRYLLTAERFDAEEGRRIGLVHEVVEPDSLRERAGEIAAALLGNGPNAIRECKALINAVARGPIDDAMIEDTAQRIARIRASEEGKEGLGAFLEKRKPGWI
ncbi:MAG: enoyl-CoA hydratase/isomerase family protein [Gammaproteobacteria bacterium]